MSVPRNRREVIGLAGGAALALPLAARAQERIRRVGVLVNGTEDDPETRLLLAAFRQGLEKLGWQEGRNVRLDVRLTLNADRFETLAKEIVGPQPEVIFVHTTPFAAAVQQETRTIPVVFTNVSDPIGSGFVASLARPGGNLTGLLYYEDGIAGKWLAMLKEMAPGLKRAAIVANPKNTAYDYFLRSAEVAAPGPGIEVVPNRVATLADIERAIEAQARTPDGGVVFVTDATLIANRDFVVGLAARHRVPAVYPLRVFAIAGGLMSYATDRAEMFRAAASYVDRILRGAKPADLPVQAPTKYETVINLKTARALGLTVPPGLLVAADEVIE